MPRKAFTLLLLASLWIAASPAAAARWTPIGPADGASVLSLAFDPVNPSVVYAGLAGGGVNRSTDGGRTWSPASFGLGLDNSLVTALAVSPGAPRNIYAGTPGGVYLSRNGGLSWQRSLSSRRVHAVAVDPRQPSRVYAGTDNGMFRSLNGGLTWARMDQGARPRFEPRFQILTLVVDPLHPRTLYASYFGADTRIYKSVNGGSTWEGLRKEWVRALAIDPQHPQTLYAAGFRKILKSTDGGRSWTNVLGAHVDTLAVDPSDPDTVYAGDSQGVLVSRDAGATWQRSSQIRDVRALAPDPSSPGTVLAGTAVDAGVYRSEDAAASWQPSDEGLIGTMISSLAAAPAGSPLFAAGSRGVYRTFNGGATWEKVLGESTGVVAFLPSHPQIVYAGLRIPDGAPVIPVFRSTNGGDTWAEASTGLPGGSVQSLVINPSDPLRLYVTLEDGRLFRSTNGGVTWHPLGFIAGKLAIDPTHPQTLFATRGKDVYRSRDGGVTWGRVMTGAVPTLDARFLNAIAIAPSDPDVVAVADSRAVFATADGGRTWSRLHGLEDAATLEFDPQDARMLYVGGPGSLLRTLDGGATWERFTLGLYGLSVLDLAFDPADPARLWAASSAAGVFAIDLD